jgi:two-component system osmolarity sensor histidine kinase EnvZ
MTFANKLLPRLFLLLTSLMIVSALSWASLFVYSEQAPRARNFAQLLSSMVNLTRSAVVAADPGRRAELLAQMTRQEGILIYPAEQNEPLPVLVDPFMLKVQEHLRQRLGQETALATERYGSYGIFVQVDIEGDDYWIGLPRDRIFRSRSLQWIGWGALAAVVALLAAVAFVSRLTQPLKRLAGAARVVGEGRHPPPLPEDGPEEMAAVATAFNQMSADLVRLDQDRALILAGISHDLRTPLTRLRMGIEMTAADDATRDGMVADVEEMDRTIGQFLDFARTDNPVATTEDSPLALLQDVAEQYRRRGTSLALDLDDVGTLSMNVPAMRRAVGNLIDNALRHAGTKVAISLALHGDEASICIEVGDRGPGIPVAERERLMRPFTRLDSARSNPAGAGLGLAIVDRIVRQHSGRTELLSREGGGLLVRIVLPRSQDRYHADSR